MSLETPSIFFDECRKGLLGPTLDNDEVSGLNALLEACTGFPISWTAYALATAYHETGHTMQPIKEYGGPKYFFRMYDPLGARPRLAKKNGNVNSGDGVKFCGRGYVQLTWRSNYKRAGDKLQIDLIGDPDLAMDATVAAVILRYGMQEGWFTGKSFASYLPDGVANLSQFTQSRRIINGTDKAALIAGYAMKFQSYLQKGGWQ